MSTLKACTHPNGHVFVPANKLIALAKEHEKFDKVVAEHTPPSSTSGQTELKNQIAALTEQVRQLSSVMTAGKAEPSSSAYTARSKFIIPDN